MALDTKVVRIGSEDDSRVAAFSAELYGETEFPRVQALIEERAVGAQALVEALDRDREAAVVQYGVMAGAQPIFSVSFTGVVGEGRSGVRNVAVEGLPPDLLIRVQTGPAINGTDIRDATGTIEFGQFTNQIEYQDAGSALNNQVKAQVLAPVEAANLTGKTISVVGVFRLVNPESWLVTPVRLDVVQ